MRNSDNYNMELPEYNDYADINVLTKIFKTIDKGIVIDVGDSTGDNNDYVLDIGNITLTALNRGVGFRFWANRDSDTTNLVKIVVDINKYNLLDMYGKNIKNIKKGTPYTVIWNGDGNFFLGSGGNTIDFSSTTVGTDGKYVLQPHTFINQNGDLDIGTMPNRGTYKQTLGLNGTIDLPYGYYDSIKITQNLATHGAITDAISYRYDNNSIYTRIPKGAYFTNSTSGYPEIKCDVEKIKNGLGENINKVIEKLGAMKSYTFTQIYSGNCPTGQILKGISNNKIVILSNYAFTTFDLNDYSIVTYKKDTGWGTPLSNENCYLLPNGNVRYLHRVLDLNQNTVSSDTNYGTQRYMSILGQEYTIKDKTLTINNIQYDIPTKDSNSDTLTHCAGILWKDWIFFKTSDGDLYTYNYKTKDTKYVYTSHDGSNFNVCYDKYDDSLVFRYATSQRGSESYTHSGLKKFYSNGTTNEIVYNESNRSYSALVMPNSFGNSVITIPVTMLTKTWTQYNNKMLMSNGNISLTNNSLIYGNKVYDFANNKVTVYQIS